MATSAIRLTAYASGGGCATKIPQSDLAAILAALPVPVQSPALLVGAHTGDDAAVYRISEDVALVVTIDFFAPVVDDPGDYGAIAAANALSDVYAMGGTPLLALNIVAWPAEDVLPASILGEVLAAGAETVRDAGALLAGGHSVRDQEPKYGLAVVGTVHPDRVMTNANGRPGDVLILTKQLGTGIVSNATKLGEAPHDVAAATVMSMRALNRDAAVIAARHGVRCATDVTGFGLLGHARNIAIGSRCAVEIDASSLPMLPGVEALVTANLVPGGSRRNLAFADTWTQWDGTVQALQRTVATDAQTSGGLLLAIEAGHAAALTADIRNAGGIAEQVGRLTGGAPGSVRVVAR
ncbi:MAG TPA: selenide, water dikinase SelD [Candidatus Dormibacteraeota bacterium]|jgi:selenide,water dikinase|nr:selenide, water dikinase SelD [Candidatus Dormibacteraeota bacterium]